MEPNYFSFLKEAACFNDQGVRSTSANVQIRFQSFAKFFSKRPRFHLYYYRFLRPVSIYTFRVYRVVFCFLIHFCLSFQWYHPFGLSIYNRYAVCNPDNKEEPNNWLRSYVIEVGDIGRLDVTFRYFTRACQPSASFCKEYFYAYVWESNTSVKAQQIPDPIKNFQLYRRFANVTRTRQSGETNLTVSLPVTSKYIVMGIRDQGGCRILYSVKISYKVCIEKTLEDSLVSLPLTISQKESTPVQGICSANSRQIVSGNLTVLCDSDGEWNTSRLESRCVCKKDMQSKAGVCTGMHDYFVLLTFVPSFVSISVYASVQFVCLNCLFVMFFLPFTFISILLLLSSILPLLLLCSCLAPYQSC